MLIQFIKNNLYVNRWKVIFFVAAFITFGVYVVLTISSGSAGTNSQQISLTSSTVSVIPGGSDTITWSSKETTSCTASGGWSGTKIPNGTYNTGALKTTTTYKLRCSGPKGSQTKSLTIDVATPTTSSSTITCQSIAIPAYFNPTDKDDPWSTAPEATPGVGLMIANPDNGPGAAATTAYSGAISNARAEGVTIFGYVSTSNATASLATVESTINAWKTMYGVTNIFFDQVTTGAGTESYYQTLSTYVHKQSGGSTTILNTGGVPNQSYMNAGDIIVSFEGDYSKYLNTTFPSWMNNYSSNHFYNIIYNVPTQSDMSTVLMQSEVNNIGYIYVTNGTAPNPFGSLPSYLSVESDDVQSNCSG
jgi:hypothetical protein